MTGEKKVLLINQHTAYLFIDIANAFARSGYKVVLVAGIIHPLERDLDGAIAIERIAAYDKTSMATRIRSWIAGFLQIMYLVVFRYPGHEVVAFSNPPLLSFLPLIARKRKMSHIIADVYPDAFAAASIIKRTSNPLYRSWEALNRISLKRFHRLFTISSGLKAILSNYVAVDSIHLFSLWSGYSTLEHGKDGREELFDRYGIPDGAFLVVYAGNLGIGHEIDKLVEIALHLKDSPHIRFMIVGDGFKKAMLQALLDKHEINNVMMLDYLEKDEFNVLIDSIQVGVVTIDERTSNISLPSKIYNLLGKGHPILSIASEGSELADMVLGGGVGINLPDDGYARAAEWLENLAADDAMFQDFRRASLALSKQYTADNANILVTEHSKPT